MLSRRNKEAVKILTLVLIIHLCYFSFRMNKEFTAREAALKVGVSYSRIRQLTATGAIDHKYFGRMLVITEKGIEQATNRKTSPGPKRQETERKAA